MSQNNQPAVSEVSISNQALGWLGANPITSLDENGAAAALCRNNYDHCRDGLLTGSESCECTVAAIMGRQSHGRCLQTGGWNPVTF